MIAVMEFMLLTGERRVTCMNYGWVADHPGAAAHSVPQLVGEERFCFQMYDAVIRAAIHGSFDSWVQEGVGTSEGGLLEGLTLAEVGCGRGGGARFLHAHHRPSQLTAMDASIAQLSIAESTRPEAGTGACLEGLSFVRASFGQRLPLTNGSVDVLISVEAMHNDPRSWPAFYEEAARVLRPGGAFAFADFRWALHLDPTPAEVPIPTSLSVETRVDITQGMLRATHRNAFWQSLHRSLPTWVLASAWARECLETLLCVPGGTRHDAFRLGTMRYVLEVYRKA